MSGFYIMNPYTISSNGKRTRTISRSSIGRYIIGLTYVSDARPGANWSRKSLRCLERCQGLIH